MATAISFPSGDTLTSPSPLVAMVGTSWSTGVTSRVLPSASVTVNRCWRLPARQSSQCRHKRRSEEHTSELQSRLHLVCRLLLEKKKKEIDYHNKTAVLHHAI